MKMAYSCLKKVVDLYTRMLTLYKIGSNKCSYYISFYNCFISQNIAVIVSIFDTKFTSMKHSCSDL